MSQAETWILVVEDEAVAALYIQQQLESLGYRTHWAAAGDEAIAWAREQDPALALLDIRLDGDMDGIELGRRLRQELDMPIIYATGYSDEETLARAKLTEPLGYVIKPFTKRELHTTVEIALYKHAAERERARLLAAEKEQRLRAERLAAHNARLYEEAQQSEARYRTVSELISDYAYQIAVREDGELVVEWATDAFQKITGFEPAVGWVKIIHPDDTPLARRRLQRLLANEPDTSEFRIVTREGDVRWLQDTARPVWDEAAGRVVRVDGAAQDVTVRREMEAAVRQTQKLESLGVMAGGVAHDFNNLLAGIQAETQLAQRVLVSGHAAGIHLERVVTSVERAAEITNQLLAYAGQGRVEMVPVEINRVIDKALPLWQVTVPRSITLNMERAPSPLPVTADPGQMQQVLLNLIMNAAEAYEGQPGLVSVATSLEKECVEESHAQAAAAGYVCVTVTDQGVGMEDTVQERIFEPFFTTKIQGRGLGLAAVQGIVREHGGRIQVKSAPGEGTTFRIFLPARTDLEPVAESAVAGEGPSASSGLVLVIEDEEVIRIAVAEMLRLQGFTVKMAANGQEGLDLFEQDEDVCLVLLDMTMPVLSGEETFAALRARRPEQPILIFSGFSRREALARVKETANTRFVQKPFKFEEVLQAIVALLDG